MKWPNSIEPTPDQRVGHCTYISNGYNSSTLTLSDLICFYKLNKMFVNSDFPLKNEQPRPIWSCDLAC